MQLSPVRLHLMLPRAYDGQDCSIAGTLGLVGDRWTLLVVREAFLGNRRFEDIQRRLGVARNVLTDRLGRLVDDGLLERVRYSERPERFEYHLTEKGLDLWPVIVALMQWGDRHRGDGRRPMVLHHRGCEGEVDDRRFCTACGAALGPRDVEAVRDGAPRLTAVPAP
jgi:DNA-binding HxlR family transcriptional regulator